MKKYLLMLAAALVLVCTACGKETETDPGTLDQEELVTAATQELIYKNEKYTLRFKKNEQGDWQWRDDTSIPLDQERMQLLLDEVGALNTLAPLENPGDITAYDLDAPDRTLEIKNEDGSGLSLQIGSAAEGGGYYMCRDGDTAKIFVAWQGTAELICKYWYKGKEILLEGKLSTREYQDKNGNDRSVTEMTVDRVHFCGKNEDVQGTFPRTDVKSQLAELDEDDSDLPF